ncbi:hypothetical protein [Amphibacillus jilinensis]|uniref:hypothetical protein n=1 Tax=Amphibacillus jilinensis TaxID=1216008 RepID=UPI0002E00CB5|nr:hypothetical protein [Amphibacillus jilinensis]
MKRIREINDKMSWSIVFLGVFLAVYIFNLDVRIALAIYLTIALVTSIITFKEDSKKQIIINFIIVAILGILLFTA